MSDEIKPRTVYMLCRKGKKEGDGLDLYIGSTSLPLEERLSGHRASAQSSRDGGSKVYKRMHEIGLQNWKMVPLLTYACDQKTIFEFEKQWVGIIGPGLNTNSPVREEETRKEYKVAYYDNNKETILKRQAAYYKNNKDVIKEQKAVYRGNNRDLVRQRVLNSQMKNIERKKYYCELCNIICRNNYDFKKHHGTYKHFKKRMWDID